METMEHKINVENFYGPLDLLLHLVKESEVDITRVSLTHVAQQYINFIQAMQKLDINVAGEFLVVAAQLMLIKSRTLLPAEEEEAEEEEDASLDLIRKLLEYRKYKSFANRMGRMAEARTLKFGRPEPDRPEQPDEEPMRDLELWDLVLSFSRISKQTLLDVPISILYQDVPIEMFIRKIMETLTEKKSARFTELVADRSDRGQVIGTFLAILELVKEQRVTTHQLDRYSDITVQIIEPNPGGTP